jgi:hypothetical protein
MSMHEPVSWRRVWQNSIVSGASASVLSTMMLALRGRREIGSPFAPTNAVSHVVWGEQAARKNRLSLRHTALGYAIHHASAMLWALIYEKWSHPPQRRASLRYHVGPGDVVVPVVPTVSPSMLSKLPAAGVAAEWLPVLGRAAAVSALACFVDYQLTPERFRPGYEKRLSRQSLTMVYAAFGLGLALPRVIARMR